MCTNVFLHFSMCTICVPGAHGAQKRACDYKESKLSQWSLFWVEAKGISIIGSNRV